ncbi:type II toxin-antitoxin system PemK/MazF family toxin [Sphaerimonospora cavernae]|uniref:Type II toxin-antitoxin system PemK/MazF family toxin n=1 Tax=Sphaerimonospora cavernae TaxID=1740611 RepID=A0ABV6UAL3_9ACTN
MAHEQRGERFAVILQSDFLAHISTVLIAPTSASAPPAHGPVAAGFVWVAGGAVARCNRWSDAVLAG